MHDNLLSRTGPAVAGVAFLFVTSPAVAQVVVTDAAGLVSAVDAATAGTVIDVAPGVYELTETLRPRVPLTIRGAGAGQTVIRNAATWQASFETRPDDELRYSSATPGAYLVDLGVGTRDVTLSGMTLAAPGLHGGVIGDDADGVSLRGLEVRDGGWSGVRLFRTADATIADNAFVNAGGQVMGRTGGSMFLTYQRDSEIFNNRIGKTPDAPTNTFGIKGRQLRDSRIHHNTILTSFAIELPFENDFGVEIDHNYLDGTVSLPKFGGGITEIAGQPVEAGDVFRLHHNYLTRSYSVEGPRNGIEIDHNLFDIAVDDDRGNLIATFNARDFTGTVPGPLSFHDNNVKNPGRGIFWSDEAWENLEFVRNHIIADDSSAEFPEGLFRFKPEDADGPIDWSTIVLADNIIEVINGSRELLRNDASGQAMIENNLLSGITDLDRYANPLTGDAFGPDVPLRFLVGVDGEFLVDGFTVTAVPEPAAGLLVAVGTLGLLRRRSA